MTIYHHLVWLSLWLTAFLTAVINSIGDDGSIFSIEHKNQIIIDLLVSWLRMIFRLRQVVWFWVLNYFHGDSP